MKTATPFVLSVAMSLLAADAAYAAAAKPEVMGRLLARATCTYCHVVTEDQGFAPPLKLQGPPFSQVAADSKNDARRLRQFLRTTHKNAGNSTGMPNPLLTNQQIDNVVSFILSLRTSP